ncbi:MAG: sugar phosphate isomerase/epimerase [Bacteroidota bacterium]
MQRRKFIQKAPALAALPYLVSCAGEKKSNEETETTDSTTSTTKNLEEIGVQIYTLRNELAENVEQTLEKVASIGYNYFESYMLNGVHNLGYSVKDFASLLKSLNLKMISAHVNTGQTDPSQEGTLVNGFEQVAENAAELGQKFIVCPYLTNEERQTIDDYKRLCDILNKCGEICKKNGLQFGYHNHDFEFETLEGEVPFDVIAANTDKDLVKFELDLYWVRKAGKDILTYFEKYPGRYPLWHVKDMEDSEEQFFAEVGSGVIDFKKIFQASEVSGMEYFFVEQDQTRKTPFESITISYNYLKQLAI